MSCYDFDPNKYFLHTHTDSECYYKLITKYGMESFLDRIDINPDDEERYIDFILNTGLTRTLYLGQRVDCSFFHIHGGEMIKHIHNRLKNEDLPPIVRRKLDDGVKFQCCVIQIRNEEEDIPKFIEAAKGILF